MAEPETLRTMDSASQERWDSWATGIARKETDRQLQITVAAVGEALGGMLSPINKRLAALESEVALLRALGPSATPAKGKAKGK